MLEAPGTKPRTSDANLLHEHWLQIHDYMRALVFNCVLETTYEDFTNQLVKERRS